jgi:PmbA protein
VNGEELLALCSDALREAGVDDVEIAAKSVRRGVARFAIGELGQHMDLEEPVAVVRVADGARVAEATTSRLDRESIVEAIRNAKAAARFVPPIDGFAGFCGEHEPSGVRPLRTSDATANATAETRVALLAPVLHAIRAAGLVSAGLLETSSTAMCVATTRGCKRAHDGALASFRVWALETPGAGGAAGYGGQMHRDVNALDLTTETDRAIRICKMSNDPIAIDEGSYDVVMEPPAVTELLEWLAGTSFGAPEVEQGASAMAGRIGEKITGTRVSISEDPLRDDEFGFAAPFDREGVWRRRIPLIERGIAREVLFDRTHASRAHTRSTGSSLLSNFSGGAMVGGSAISLDAGDAASVDELISGIDRGLYICRLHYVNGLLETRRAVMTGLTRDGCFLIEKGKLTRPVGNLRFTDSFLEALDRSDGMTRARTAVPNFWSDGGSCTAPAVRMRAMRFNGKSQERPKFD